MKQTDSYILQQIFEDFYLLPYGQNIADHKRSVRLNKTGVFLWNTLAKEPSRKELLQAFADFCQAIPDELPILEKDLEDFLSPLLTLGMIEDDSKDSVYEPFYKTLCIGELYVNLHGRPSLFSSQFDLFEEMLPEHQQPDLTIQIHTGAPNTTKNGKILIRNHDLVILEQENSYSFFFPSMKQIVEARITKDGLFAELYCQLPETDALIDDLFHALRLLYLYRAQKDQIFAIHSASILYEGKAWLFSGHSGVGKSTHTKLWNDVLHTPFLNGDLNLISIKDGRPVVYGLPWCGTSQIVTKETHMLGGIVLLQQAPENRIENLSPSEQSLLVMQRLISPTWTSKHLKCCLNFTNQLVPNIFVTRLCCNVQPEAVSCIQQAIQHYMKGSEK